MSQPNATLALTYSKIKKRIHDYRLQYGVTFAGTFVFAILFFFSLLPLIPAVLANYFNFGSFSIFLYWALCSIGFGYLFSRSNKKVEKVNKEYGVELEERIFVSAYEALCFLDEYLDPNHPIISSKRKSIQKLQGINYSKFLRLSHSKHLDN